MQINDYHTYTQSLVDLAQSDNRIEGLVVLGSTARTHHQPDQWSDHDFWLIVKEGTEDEFHNDLSWIPQIERKVLAFRETRHGWKIVFDDGHVLEYAIFPPSDLSVARFHHYQLLVDKSDVADRLSAIKAIQAQEMTQPTRPLTHVQLLLALLVIGMGRYHRGEKISAMVFIKHYALEQMTSLIQSLVPPHPHMVDDLNPNRRFEQTHPQYAEQLHFLLTATIPDSAECLLDMTVTFADDIPDFPLDAIDTVRRVIRHTK